MSSPAAPPTVDQVIARIRAFATWKRWAPSRLAVEAGLSNMALRDMDAPGWSPTTATLRKLEALIPADFDLSAHPQQERVA